MGTLKILTTKIFPEATEAGSFGADITKFLDFKFDGQNVSDQFCSDITFGEVTLETSTGQHTTQSVVIKTRKPPNSWGVDPDVAFHNEVLFYTKAIPSLRKYDKDGFLTTCFPEFVYGKATNGAYPDEDMIILKNLNEKGFKLSEERLHLDEKHMKLALDRLAKFHALSLAYQTNDPESYTLLVNQIKFLNFGDVFDVMSKEEFVNILQRGVEPLKKDPKYKDKLSDLYANFDCALELWKKYVLPTGPLIVLCHGDFHRNNIMFKYAANGDPIEMVFFDFQLIKNSTPVVDILKPLFWNVTPEVRRLHWDAFLRSYYDSLSRQLNDSSKTPSFEAVDFDVRNKGILIYYGVSIMIPLFLSHINGENVPGSDLNWKDLDHSQLKKALQQFSALEVGGPRATEFLAEIVKHMLDKNFSINA